MFERLQEARRAMVGFAACFDPEVVSGVDAAMVVDEAARIEKAAVPPPTRSPLWSG